MNPCAFWLLHTVNRLARLLAWRLSFTVSIISFCLCFLPQLLARFVGRLRRRVLGIRLHHILVGRPGRRFRRFLAVQLLGCRIHIEDRFDLVSHVSMHDLDCMIALAFAFNILNRWTQLASLRLANLCRHTIDKRNRPETKLTT